MGLSETIPSLWYLYDFLFLVGMFISLNVDAFQNEVVLKGGKALLQNYVIKNTDLPAHVIRKLERSKKILTYRVIYSLLGLASVLNILTNVLGDRRLPIINYIYIFYCLATVFVSAHDILFHDDRMGWNTNLKRRHVIFPFNLEGSRVFGKALDGNQTVTQLYTASKKLKDPAPVAGILLSGLAYKFMPRGLHFLCNIVYLGAHSSVNKGIDNLFDYFTIKTYRNRYEHMFEDFNNIFVKSDTHEQLGRQYQYFKYSFKPLEKVLKMNVFDKARKMKMNVQTSKALTYLARGCVVSLAFSLFNTTSQLELCVPLMAYYGFHAAVAYANKEDKILDTPIKRRIAKLVEQQVSGFLFYRPLMDSLKDSKLPIIVLGSAAILGTVSAINTFKALKAAKSK